MKTKNIEVRVIAFNSPERDLEIKLRTKILREPLGLRYTDEELREEKSDIHIGAFDGTQLVGCLLLRRVTQTTMKMRQVAVDGTLQGQGIGKKMVIYSEDFCRSRGFTTLELHARENAIPFYKSLGYATEGEPFTEVTIPHMKMRKKLNAAAFI